MQHATSDGRISSNTHVKDGEGEGGQTALDGTISSSSSMLDSTGNTMRPKTQAVATLNATNAGSPVSGNVPPPSPSVLRSSDTPSSSGTATGCVRWCVNVALQSFVGEPWAVDLRPIAEGATAEATPSIRPAEQPRPQTTTAASRAANDSLNSSINTLAMVAGMSNTTSSHSLPSSTSAVYGGRFGSGVTAASRCGVQLVQMDYDLEQLSSTGLLEHNFLYDSHHEEWQNLQQCVQSVNDPPVTYGGDELLFRFTNVEFDRPEEGEEAAAGAGSGGGSNNNSSTGTSEERAAGENSSGSEAGTSEAGQVHYRLRTPLEAMLHNTVHPAVTAVVAHCVNAMVLVYGATQEMKQMGLIGTPEECGLLPYAIRVFMERYLERKEQQSAGLTSPSATTMVKDVGQTTERSPKAPCLAAAKDAATTAAVGAMARPQSHGEAAGAAAARMQHRLGQTLGFSLPHLGTVSHRFVRVEATFIAFDSTNVVDLLDLNNKNVELILKLAPPPTPTTFEETGAEDGNAGGTPTTDAFVLNAHARPAATVNDALLALDCGLEHLLQALEWAMLQSESGSSLLFSLIAFTDTGRCATMHVLCLAEDQAVQGWLSSTVLARSQAIPLDEERSWAVIQNTPMPPPLHHHAATMLVPALCFGNMFTSVLICVYNSAAALSRLSRDLTFAVTGYRMCTIPRVTLASSRRSTHKLPPGWEEHFTKDGRRYFMDTSTQTTTWDDPRLSAQGGNAAGGRGGARAGRGGGGNGGNNGNGNNSSSNNSSNSNSNNSSCSSLVGVSGARSPMDTAVSSAAASAMANGVRATYAAGDACGDYGALHAAAGAASALAAMAQHRPTRIGLAEDDKDYLAGRLHDQAGMALSGAQPPLFQVAPVDIGIVVIDTQCQPRVLLHATGSAFEAQYAEEVARLRAEREAAMTTTGVVAPAQRAHRTRAEATADAAVKEETSEAALARVASSSSPAVPPGFASERDTATSASAIVARRQAGRAGERPASVSDIAQVKALIRPPPLRPTQLPELASAPTEESHGALHQGVVDTLVEVHGVDVAGNEVREANIGDGDGDSSSTKERAAVNKEDSCPEVLCRSAASLWSESDEESFDKDAVSTVINTAKFYTTALQDQVAEAYMMPVSVPAAAATSSTATPAPAEAPAGAPMASGLAAGGAAEATATDGAGKTTALPRDMRELETLVDEFATFFSEAYQNRMHVKELEAELAVRRRGAEVGRRTMSTLMTRMEQTVRLHGPRQLQQHLAPLFAAAKQSCSSATTGGEASAGVEGEGSVAYMARDVAMRVRRLWEAAVRYVGPREAALRVEVQEQQAARLVALEQQSEELLRSTVSAYEATVTALRAENATLRQHCAMATSQLPQKTNDVAADTVATLPQLNALLQRHRQLFARSEDDKGLEGALL